MTKKDKTTRKAIGYGIGLMVILGPECQVVSCKFMIIFEYEKSQDKLQVTPLVGEYLPVTTLL